MAGLLRDGKELTHPASGTRGSAVGNWQHQTDYLATMEKSACLDSEDLGRGCVFAAPGSNDWYLTTDDSVTLGPYRSCQEAVRLQGLLRDHPSRGLLDKGSRAA